MAAKGDNGAATWGLLAEFETPAAIYTACQRVREAGYTRFDAHTPFPVHGLDKAMGLPASRLPWLVLVAGLGGAGGGMLLQWWVSAVHYPLVISGKPLFSWPAFVPVTFELGVLMGALAAVFGMFFLNRLPHYYHPVFHSQRFDRCSDDRFFLSLEAADPRFEAESARNLLRQAGAVSVEELED